MSQYKERVRDLILFQQPLAHLLDRLSGADSLEDEDTAQLTRMDVAAVLARYMQGALSAQDVRDWAVALELRDDIDFAADVDGLFRAIYLLATPELEGPLDVERAKALLAVLQAEPPCREEDIDDAYAR